VTILHLNQQTQVNIHVLRVQPMGKLPNGERQTEELTKRQRMRSNDKSDTRTLGTISQKTTAMTFKEWQKKPARSRIRVVQVTQQTSHVAH
jgi:hypothetical protein